MAKKLQMGTNIVFVLFLVSLLALPSAQAADKKAELKVYQKFCKVTGMESQYNQIINLIVSQFQQNFLVRFREAAKKMENATPEKQAKFRQLFEKTMASYSRKIRAKTTEMMPFNELINDVYYPVFSKHFTVAEIRELTAFFEKPLGKKYVSSMPTILQESLTLINQKFAAPLQKIGSEIADTEMKKIKPELKKLQKKN